MKPSWDEAPAWANWLAMDNDGAWYWYEREPTVGHTAFIPESDSDIKYAPSLNWKESLERRP